ncbi:MAG: hypothetical protein AAGG09_02230 [Pseudomonadota bacterium]
MAKKKSAAELKQEGVALGEQIAQARKKVVNFALSMGKEGLVLETDLKKSPDVLWRAAKKLGGPKGAQGQMKVTGKVIELTCVDDSAPTQLPKLAKKFLNERGQPYKVVMITPSGQIGDGDDEEEGETATAEAGTMEEAPPPEEEGTTAPTTEDAPEEPGQGEETDPERAELMAEFEAMSERLELAKNSVHAGAAKKSVTLSETFLTQVEEAPGKARGLLKVLRKTIEDAINFGVAGPQGAATGDPEPGGAPEGRKAAISQLKAEVQELLAELA